MYGKRVQAGMRIAQHIDRCSSCIFILVITISGILLINYFPGTIGNKKEKSFGKGDVTLDIYDWKFFKNEFEKIYKKEANRQNI